MASTNQFFDASLLYLSTQNFGTDFSSSRFGEEFARALIFDDEFMPPVTSLLSIVSKIKGSMKSAPGWNEKLASESEAVIKAEREPHPSSVVHLQRESISILSQEYDNVKVKYDNDDV
ncbi:13155_t:CDS:2, partial [Acaulospora colombiana]